ncbi:MAG: YceI family protein [Proteobacteria bacterium]|nr:YceI family protein [Pseudomonadota bacterium]
MPSPRPSAPGPAQPRPLPSAHAAANLGQPYDIDAAGSLLTVLVWPAGTLAAFGHSHVIASHDLRGTLYLPANPDAASARVEIPVDSLTVDEPSLRADAGPDFAAAVPQEAREGTRRNMLGSAVLDAAEFPVIELDAGGDCAARRQLSGAASAPVCVAVTVRGVTRQLALPLHWQLSGGQLTVSGETALRQSDLGLTPLNAMLGALQVRDEMRVRVRLLAQRAVTAP